MNTRTAWFAIALVVLMPTRGIAQDELEESLRAHVDYLAAPEREGRGVGSEGLEAAARYVEEQLREAGVEPLPGHEFRQEFEHEGATLANVTGWIEGSRPLEEAGCVVLGAHYDGQGIDDDGRLHPSADDNASGTAALLAVARVLRSAMGPLERPVLLVAFTGEESGLLGSRHFVADPPVPLEHVRAMVNLDTVGRVQSDQLTVFGSSSAAEFEKILAGVNLAAGFDLRTVAKSPAASDDAPFLEKGIPALHVFSGAHDDYHRPGDTADEVSVEGLARIAWFAADLTEYLSRADTQLSFVPAGAESVKAMPRTEGRRRVSFGSIPDFQRESGGVLLTGVLPNSPAEQAGLAQGDIIVAFAGVEVDNLVDYSEAMKQFAPGDQVVVRFLRDGETREVTVTLTERK